MLKDKVVVITGGAGLIGREFVKTVAKNGGTAVIADIDPAAALKAGKEIAEDTDTKHLDAVSIDITSKQSINDCIDALMKKYGRIDALVNSAYPRNKNYGRHFFDVEYEDFIQNTGLNLGGYFLSSQQFSKFFCEQGHGNIINIASIYGVVAPKFEIYEGTKMTMPVEYAAIKAGILHLTRYMAAYFKGRNIRVNCITPGGILDGQPEAFLKKYKDQCLNKGMLDKSDLNGALVFLLSDMSTYVNGQNIIVDDGFSL